MNNTYIIILLLISGVVIYWNHISILPKDYFKNRKWYILLYDSFLEILAIFCVLTAIKLL